MSESAGRPPKQSPWWTALRIVLWVVNVYCALLVLFAITDVVTGIRAPAVGELLALVICLYLTPRLLRRAR